MNVTRNAKLFRGYDGYEGVEHCHCRRALLGFDSALMYSQNKHEKLCSEQNRGAVDASFHPRVAADGSTAATLMSCVGCGGGHAVRIVIFMLLLFKCFFVCVVACMDTFAHPRVQFPDPFRSQKDAGGPADRQRPHARRLGGGGARLGETATVSGRCDPPHSG